MTYICIGAYEDVVSPTLCGVGAPADITRLDIYAVSRPIYIYPEYVRTPLRREPAPSHCSARIGFAGRSIVGESYLPTNSNSSKIFSPDRSGSEFPIVRWVIIIFDKSPKPSTSLDYLCCLVIVVLTKMQPPQPVTAGEAQALRQRVVAQLDAVKKGEETSSLGEGDLKNLISIVDWFRTSTTTDPTSSHPRTDPNNAVTPTPTPTLQNILEVVLRTEKKLDTEKTRGTYAVAARQGNTVAPTEGPSSRPEPPHQPVHRELKSFIVQIKDISDAAGIQRVARTELLS